MSDKHYNAEYLNETGKILKNLKHYSYQPFLSLTSGTIVDLGCGTGADAIALAQQVNSDVRLVGIDHDPAMLKIANENNTSSRLSFIQSEASTIPFGNEEISGLRAERLVQHLTDPAKTFKEIDRVLKPDGNCVIVETDWNSLTLYSDQVETELKVVKYLTDKKVNNGFAAHLLTSYFRQINLRNIQLEIFPFNLKSLKQANEYLWLNYILKDSLDQQIIDQSEFDSLNNSLEIADHNGYFNCSINIVIGTGTK